MSALIDTGVALAIINPKDHHHKRCLRAIADEEEPLLPMPILPELAYMTIRDVGYHRFVPLMQMFLQNSNSIVYPVEADLVRIGELMGQYADARIDFVDCAVIAMAERLNISRILTVDQRDFRMVRPRHVSAFTIIP